MPYTIVSPEYAAYEQGYDDGHAGEAYSPPSGRFAREYERGYRAGSRRFAYSR